MIICVLQINGTNIGYSILPYNYRSTFKQFLYQDLVGKYGVYSYIRIDDIVMSCWMGVAHTCMVLLPIHACICNTEYNGRCRAWGRKCSLPGHQISHLALPGVPVIMFTIDFTTDFVYLPLNFVY